MCCTGMNALVSFPVSKSKVVWANFRHVVDTQSFPFESRTYPHLWDGSFTKAERYSQEDIKGLVEYGRQRGVKVPNH